MTSVDKYVTMAEEAQGNKAHVAVLFNYWAALEETGYSSNAAPILLEAVRYAQKLVKKRDCKEVANWGLRVVEKMKPSGDLATTINQEIAKLQTAGKENATS